MTPQSRTRPARPRLGLEDRITGALVGAAVGDALGGPGGGLDPGADRGAARRPGRRHRRPVPPTTGAPPARIAPYHKGDGHVTDDTLMTHALVRVYETVRDHLDAYAIADHLVPDLIGTPRWIPELEAEALPLQRIFLAEKWIVARLHYGHVDPREAGVGNIVNCGAAMYMAPVGIVNAGNPDRAYAEALDIAGRPPVLVRAGGGGGVRGGGGRRVPPGRDPGLGRRPGACGSPRTAPGPRSRRSARRRPGHADFEVGAGPAARGGRPLRHGRPGLPQPVARRPAPLPAARHRGTARSPWACCWSAAATSGTRSSARSTTAATATRSPR